MIYIHFWNESIIQVSNYNYSLPANNSINERFQFLAKFSGHKSVNHHIQSCVQSQAEMTDVNQNKRPCWSDVFHPAILTSVRNVQVNEFMTIQDQSWNVTDYKRQCDADEDHGCSVFSSSLSFVDSFHSEMKYTYIIR